MPQMTGIDLIRDLRAVNPEVPIVLISGFTDALGLDEETTGADAVIQKNHSEVQTLVRTVTRLLNRSTKKKPAKKQSPAPASNARRRG
jgi:FixJ family two-component response regulator